MENNHEGEKKFDKWSHPADLHDRCPVFVMKAICTRCPYQFECEIEPLQEMLKECQSPIEYWLAMMLHAEGFGENLFAQLQLDEEATRPDFVIFRPKKKLAIYCDSEEFHSKSESMLRDRQIDRRLHRRGWIVLRFMGSEIMNNLKGCVEEIKQALEDDE